MSKNSSGSGGCAGWFKWLIGSMIAVLAAGGGIVALLGYLDNQNRIRDEQYQQNLVQWNNFSPSSLLGGNKDVTLRGLDRIDLESGRVSQAPQADRQWDLEFVCGAGGYEALRALDGVSWFERGVADLNAIKYREIRDAEYKMRKNPTTGYNDLYYVFKSNAPSNGYVFFVKTPASSQGPKGSVAKLQIIGYELVDSNPQVCRNMRIKYDIFPVVGDPDPPRK